MGDLSDFISDGIDDMSELEGVTFSINGHEYTGVRNSGAYTESLEVGGFMPSFQDSIVATKPQFLEVPTVGMMVSISGSPYRITAVNEDEPSYELKLESIAK